jgi:hypothetical protein
MLSMHINTAFPSTTVLFNPIFLTGVSISYRNSRLISLTCAQSQPAVNTIQKLFNQIESEFNHLVIGLHLLLKANQLHD